MVIYFQHYCWMTSRVQSFSVRHKNLPLLIALPPQLIKYYRYTYKYTKVYLSRPTLPANMALPKFVWGGGQTRNGKCVPREDYQAAIIRTGSGFGEPPILKSIGRIAWRKCNDRTTNPRWRQSSIFKYLSISWARRVFQRPSMSDLFETKCLFS